MVNTTDRALNLAAKLADEGKSRAEIMRTLYEEIPVKRPTDEELEAMAVRLEAVPRPSMLDTLKFCPHEAAAMLRACKGRVRVKPLVWEQARDGAGWHPQLSIAYCPVFEKLFYAERPEKQVKIDAAREARILAALEPAPDQGEWNAAIEAAKKMMGDYHWNRYRTRDQGGELHYPAVFTSHTHRDVQDALDTLKKGQTND